MRKKRHRPDLSGSKQNLSRLAGSGGSVLRIGIMAQNGLNAGRRVALRARDPPRHPGPEPERAADPPMTHTALVTRRIAFLRQASGVTIAVRLGDHDPQQPKQKARRNLMTLAAILRDRSSDREPDPHSVTHIDDRDRNSHLACIYPRAAATAYTCASAPIDVWPIRIMVDPGWTRYGFTINVLGTCANHTLRLSANRVQLA